MGALLWTTVALCLLQGGYLVFDGVRALVTGDYLTPRSGDHAGQLGPWAGLLRAIGVSPHARAVKLAFVVLGVGWLAVALALAAGWGWAWAGASLVAVGTLWYLVPGTVISIVVLVLVLVTPLRSALTGG